VVFYCFLVAYIFYPRKRSYEYLLEFSLVIDILSRPCARRPDYSWE
jgi:hypothetical protein